ncbi:MAG TPA: glycerol-3-phosphate responsive antiterminator [Symbiobacteriaceae bacterium]|nr:glycerol-3-phosphate responsive antiterminator [Symbiobacteriaceae bacterium]
MAAEGVHRLRAALEAHPVIAAVRDEAGLKHALAAPVQVIFLLAAEISRLEPLGQVVAEAGKLLFIHLDFVEGLGKDEAGLSFLARHARPAGVITTRTGLVHAARRIGVIPVQRLFLLDSQSLSTGLEAARTAKAEVVEVLPGIVPRAISAVRSQLPNSLIIAGGLVRTEKEAARAVAAGAAGVSTSSGALWRLDPATLQQPDGGQTT